jgi:hypothetical protein
MSNDIHGRYVTGVTRKFVTLGATLLAGLFAVTVQAFPELDLEVGTPDLYSNAITVNYDSNSGVFTATGYASRLEGLGDIAGGTFSLSATIVGDGAGAIATGGSIVIDGNGGNLLTGSFAGDAGTVFGGNANGTLDFLFDIDGGDVAGLFGGIGGVGGLILSNSGFGGSFGSNFGTMYNAMANTFGHGGPGVPIPGTLWLLLAGSGWLIFRRRGGIEIKGA